MVLLDFFNGFPLLKISPVEHSLCAVFWEHRTQRQEHRSLPTKKKINISQIVPNPLQPRKNFKDNELKELSNSIKNQGLIQPIIVKPVGNEQYQIIAGERRWRACQLNGFHELDCVVKNLDDTNVLEAALIENIQREDLNVKGVGNVDSYFVE